MPDRAHEDLRHEVGRIRNAVSHARGIARMIELQPGHGTAIEAAPQMLPPLPRFPSPSAAQEAVEVFGYVFLASGWSDAEQIDAIESYRDNATDPQRKAIYSLALALVFRGPKMRKHLLSAVALATDPVTRQTALSELRMLNWIGRVGRGMVRKFRPSGMWYSDASRRLRPSEPAALPGGTYVRTGRYESDRDGPGPAAFAPATETAAGERPWEPGTCPRLPWGTRCDPGTVAPP